MQGLLGAFACVLVVGLSSLLLAGCDATGAAQEMLDRVSGSSPVAPSPSPVVAAAVPSPTMPPATVTPTSSPTRVPPTATPSPSPSPSPTSTPVPKPIAVLKSGFGQSTGPVGFALEVENPNPGLAVEDSLYRVAVLDKDRALIKVVDGRIGLILPGQKLMFADDLYLFRQDPEVGRLEVAVMAGRHLPTNLQPGLVAEDAAYRHDIWFPRVTGVVVNPYNWTLERVRVSAVLYSAAGDIVGAGSGYVNFVPAGGKAPVAIDVIASQRPAKVELYPAVGALSQLQNPKK